MKQEDKMSKTKLVPFDVEKAKNGAKVVTRNGLPVKIVDYPIKNEDCPILGLVLIEGKEFPLIFTNTGSHYNNSESCYDLFIEEEVEEDDSDYDPYKATVESIADMAERYAELQSLEELKHFYNNVRVKCREAVEYDNTWNKKQDEKPADIFEIKPDKWYTCIETCHSIDVIDFMEGHYYLGSDILKYGLLEKNKDYIDYFHSWTIKGAKDGDVLVCIGGKYGQEIGIVKKYVGKYGGCDKCFETYCFVDWEGRFRLGEYMGSKEIYPATKEQRDLLFQKMKEAGYEWNSDKKELHKIKKEVKTRRMTNQELSWWLREHPEEHREMTYSDEDNYVSSDITYLKSEANIQVYEKIVIRKNGGEWEEPLIEE